MKRHFLTPLLLLLFATVIAPAQDMVRVRQTIDTLCSPTLHGRGYILDGDAKAAAYIKSRFEQAGLQRFGNSYFQEFALPVNRIVQTPRLKVQGQQLQPGYDFVAHAASASGKGSAATVYLDSATLADAAATQKFFTRNLRNKVLVYRQQDQKQLQALPYQPQLQSAKAHVVLQPEGLLTTVTQEQAAIPVLEVAAARWPANAGKVEFSVVADLNQNHRTQNVIAFVPGSVQPDSFVVFTAHYDHLGGQGQDLYFAGANDNASGTAMLLELAAHYSQPENKPRYSIAFVAFAAEEAGLVGSFHYVENPLFPLPQIKFLVNLDLLGTGDDGLMAVNGAVHVKEFEQLTQLNTAGNLLPRIRSRGKAANSDHYPFSEKGVPAFFFYTLGGTTAYHNVHDRPEQLPLTRFTEVFKLITKFAAKLQH